jgi:hypothetical protein
MMYQIWSEGCAEEEEEARTGLSDFPGTAPMTGKLGSVNSPEPPPHVYTLCLARGFAELCANDTYSTLEHSAGRDPRAQYTYSEQKAMSAQNDVGD